MNNEFANCYANSVFPSVTLVIPAKTTISFSHYSPIIIIYWH